MKFSFQPLSSWEKSWGCIALLLSKLESDHLKGSKERIPQINLWNEFDFCEYSMRIAFLTIGAGRASRRHCLQYSSSHYHAPRRRYAATFDFIIFFEERVVSAVPSIVLSHKNIHVSVVKWFFSCLSFFRFLLLTDTVCGVMSLVLVLHLMEALHPTFRSVRG